MSAMLKQTKWTILLSINAVAILIAGILIAGAVFFNGGIEFRVVSEYSDDVSSEIAEEVLIEPDLKGIEADVKVDGYEYSFESSNEISSEPVPSGELWNETSITIYQTADIDICVGGELDDLGGMYWQSSNHEVINGFYNSARTWLGYDDTRCRYPSVAGTGTTTITAGTYDGLRRDTITITVIAPPVEQWKREVLSIVNNIRAKEGLNELKWGVTCEDAANTRADEIVENYSHTRPDGREWSTACPLVDRNSISGENLAAGNAAVSPASTVMTWMKSPTHRENILSPNFTNLSVGFTFEPDTNYKTYWSEYFSNY